MKKIILALIFLLISSFSIAKTQKEEYQNDYLYSAEYFDYLIECAQEDRERMLQEEKKQSKLTEQSLNDEDIEIITQEFEPFHLKIEENIKTQTYKESFKKIDTKTIIPISNKISVIQDLSKARNKYNANDYKILTEINFQPLKTLGFASGLETNFRGLDQNPASRKLYFTPGINLGNKISLKFHNKVNILNYSSDHDIGLNVSPFKSKIIDFGVYSGITRKRDGRVTKSINFSTNFYF